MSHMASISSLEPMITSGGLSLYLTHLLKFDGHVRPFLLWHHVSYFPPQKGSPSALLAALPNKSGNHPHLAFRIIHCCSSV